MSVETAPATSPRPQPRVTEGPPDIPDPSGDLAWQFGRSLRHSTQSDWFPFLVLALVGLATLFILQWAGRRRAQQAASPRAAQSGEQERFTRRTWTSPYLDDAGRRKCRWRKDKRRHGATLVRWQCMECGVDAFTQDGKPPKECKRLLRETAL